MTAPAVLRIRENSVQALTIFISEEQSVDLKSNHLAEAGGYFAFALNDPTGDPDSDGLTTEDEDFIYATHPGMSDTDQDGIQDGAEVDLWQSLGGLWSGDIDQDGVINLLDSDADGDGMSDQEEVAMGYDPGNPHDLDVSEFILGIETYKIKGDKYAELTWSGTNSGYAEIYRDGNLLLKVTNNGTYTHGPFSSGKRATYRVCEPGTTRCSNEATLNW